MDPVFKKMNWKDQSEVVVLQAPESFQSNMDAMTGLTTFQNELRDLDQIAFAIVFVTRQAEIDRLVPLIAPKLFGDALLWMCYPKGSSKNYTCEFNRDTGWAILGEYGMEPVRQVAVDADWSALRFRKVAYIKQMTRRKEMALSREGKKRSKDQGKG